MGFGQLDAPLYPFFLGALPSPLPPAPSEHVLICTVFKSELITTLTGTALFVLTWPHLTTAMVTITLNTAFPGRPLNVFN